MSDDVSALDRRLDLLTGELRDLVRWLKSEQTERLKRIEDRLDLFRMQFVDHDRRIGDLREDLTKHDQRLAALEAARKDTP